MDNDKSGVDPSGVVNVGHDAVQLLFARRNACRQDLAATSRYVYCTEQTRIVQIFVMVYQLVATTFLLFVIFTHISCVLSPERF